MITPIEFLPDPGQLSMVHSLPCPRSTWAERLTVRGDYDWNVWYQSGLLSEAYYAAQFAARRLEEHGFAFRIVANDSAVDPTSPIGTIVCASYRDVSVIKPYAPTAGTEVLTDSWFHDCFKFEAPCPSERLRSTTIALCRNFWLTDPKAPGVLFWLLADAAGYKRRAGHFTGGKEQEITRPKAFWFFSSVKRQLWGCTLRDDHREIFYNIIHAGQVLDPEGIGLAYHEYENVEPAVLSEFKSPLHVVGHRYEILIASGKPRRELESYTD